MHASDPPVRRVSRSPGQPSVGPLPRLPPGLPAETCEPGKQKGAGHVGPRLQHAAVADDGRALEHHILAYLALAPDGDRRFDVSESGSRLPSSTHTPGRTSTPGIIYAHTAAQGVGIAPDVLPQVAHVAPVPIDRMRVKGHPLLEKIGEQALAEVIELSFGDVGQDLRLEHVDAAVAET